MNRWTSKRGTPADAAMRKQVRDVVNRVGDKLAAKELGIGRATVSRILGELPISSGTLALVRERLAQAATS